MKKWSTLLFMFIVWGHVDAQPARSYANVDQYAQQLGPMNTMNLARIADTLTQPFSSKTQKARAIYSWIIENIAIDPKNTKTNDPSKSTPLKVITTRQANAKGFANLFQEMCSQADIRCIVVEGFTRNHTEEIENAPDEANHAWNVVQLGKSETEWFYVDACKGSGILDKRQTTFTKQTTYSYFFPSNTLFNLDHYPSNKAWQFGEGSSSVKQFYTLPIVGFGAYNLSLNGPLPKQGLIKTSPGKSVRFRFHHDATTTPDISLHIGEGNKVIKPQPFNVNDENGWIEFSYTFKTEGDYPVTILAQRQPLLTYLLEVSE